LKSEKGVANREAASRRIFYEQLIALSCPGWRDNGGRTARERSGLSGVLRSVSHTCKTGVLNIGAGIFPWNLSMVRYLNELHLFFDITTISGIIRIDL